MNHYKSFILLFSCLFFSKAYTQSVDFTYSTANNLFCNPQVVTFTQNCSGTPDGFIWRFGNGQSGTLPVQTVTYLLPGSYTVTLTAVYANTAISETKTIVINPTPVISISANRNYICQPGNIIFTAPGSPFLTSYEWDFGDGSGIVVTNINTVTHFFNSYNNFTVTVKGITVAGCSATTSMGVQIARFPITGASVLPLKLLQNSQQQ